MHIEQMIKCLNLSGWISNLLCNRKRRPKVIVTKCEKRGMRGSKKCQIEHYVTGERSLVHETQDPKAKENKLRQKNLTLWFVLIEKMVFGSTSNLRFQRQKRPKTKNNFTIKLKYTVKSEEIIGFTSIWFSIGWIGWVFLPNILWSHFTFLINRSSLLVNHFKGI